MGLDTVELIMEVEETFGITIRDEDAAEIGTVGQLHRCIMDRLRAKQVVPCPGASGFYRVRQAMIERWGVARGAIRPGSLIRDLMPEGRPGLRWAALGESLEARLPQLRPPGWIAPTAFAVYFASVALGLGRWAGDGGPGLGNLIFAAGVSFVGFLMALGFLLAVSERNIPPDCETVGGAARLVGARCFAPVGLEVSSLEIWDAVRRVVGEQLGFDPDRLTEETHIVHDLGAG